MPRCYECPPIPALHENRLELLSESWLCRGTLRTGPHPQPRTAGAPEARLGLELSASCVLCRPALTPRPSAPVGKFVFPAKISWDGNYCPRSQKCEIRLAPSEALRASVPGLSPACGDCQRAWAGLRPHVAFSLQVCLSVCAFSSYKHPVTESTAHPNLPDLSLTNYTFQNLISRDSHFLGFWVNVNLGRTLPTRDTAPGAEGTGPRPWQG